MLVDASLARRLVDAQLAPVDPVAAAGEITVLDQGWDNAVFRLGDELVLRIPRREVAAPLVEHEARWLATVSAPLAVPTPVPVFVGAPQEGYPWTWLVCPYLPGSVVATLPVERRAGLVEDLAAALTALHRPAPAAAPPNPFRGVPLAARAGVRERIEGWHGPVAPLLAAWDRGVAAPAYDGPPLWLHGDPHPLNLLHTDGRLSGLLDFGDLTAGDPASDLATAWWTFGATDRLRFREAVGRAHAHDADVWTRAAAWAAALASAVAPGAPMEPVALFTAEQLADDR